MARNMPTADNARHIANPSQGPAKGPLRKAVRSFDTSIPAPVKAGLQFGKTKRTRSKTLPQL